MKAAALALLGEAPADFEQVHVRITAAVETIERWRLATAEREQSPSKLAVEALELLTARP